MKKIIITLILTFTTHLGFSAEGGAADGGGTDLHKSTMAEVVNAFEFVQASIQKSSSLSNPDSMAVSSTHPYYLLRRKLNELKRDEDDMFISHVIFIKPDGYDELLIKLDATNKRLSALESEMERLILSGASIEEVKPISEEIEKSLDLLVEYSEGVRSLYQKSFDNKAMYDDSRFIIKYEDVCYDLKGNKKVAAVTSFSSDGKICMSFKLLQSVQPYNLVKTIMGIVLHEVAHLSGHNEQDAMRAQELFHEFSDHILNLGLSERSPQLELLYKISLRNAIHELDMASGNFSARLGWGEIESAHKLLVYEVARVIGKLNVLSSLLPDYKEPGAYDLSFRNSVDEVGKTLWKSAVELRNVIKVGNDITDEEVVVLLDQQVLSLQEIFKQVFGE